MRAVVGISLSQIGTILNNSFIFQNLVGVFLHGQSSENAMNPLLVTQISKPI